MEITEHDYENGWHIKVGQVYSSPYEDYHIKVVKIELDPEHPNPDDYLIHFLPVRPDDYNIVIGEPEWHRAWHINGGTWDLELDIDL